MGDPIQVGDTVNADFVPDRKGGIVTAVDWPNVTVDWPAEPEWRSRAMLDGVVPATGLPAYPGATHHGAQLKVMLRADGTPPMYRYAVEVERIATTTVYISAPDVATAGAEALRLARSDSKFEDAFDEATYTSDTVEITGWPLDDPFDDSYWTGGPDGEWADFTDDIDPEEATT